MEKEALIELLFEAQTNCFRAHTNQITDLLNKNEDGLDDVIKMLIDERRHVYEEFAQRLSDLKS